MDINTHLVQFGLTIVYSIVGLLFFGLGYLLFDRLTPFSVRKEIEEDQNTSLAIIIGAVIIGLSIIIAAAIT
jgi:putative membrane protein